MQVQPLILRQILYSVAHSRSDAHWCELPWFHLHSSIKSLPAWLTLPLRGKKHGVAYVQLWKNGLEDDDDYDEFNLIICRAVVC